MPYMRTGATKVSDHWVRSPLLNIARACQTCHRAGEGEIRARVDGIQQRNHGLMQRAGAAVVDLIDAVRLAKSRGATQDQLAPALALQRSAQWRLDFIAAENSMGFHAPHEAARILAEAIDLARQGQLAVVSSVPSAAPPPAPPAGSAPAGSDAGSGAPAAGSGSGTRTGSAGSAAPPAGGSGTRAGSGATPATR
jgi:nitrite reductase (cytochrome c-552)